MPSKGSKRRKPSVTYGRTPRKRGFQIYEDVVDEPKNTATNAVGEGNSARHGPKSSTAAIKDPSAGLNEVDEENPFADPENDELSAPLTSTTTRARPVYNKKRTASFSVVIPQKKTALTDKSTNHPPRARHNYHTIGDEAPILSDTVVVEPSSVKGSLPLPTTPTRKSGSVIQPDPPLLHGKAGASIASKKKHSVTSPSTTRPKFKHRPHMQVISVGETDMVQHYDGDVSNTSLDQPESFGSSESNSSRTSAWVKEMTRGMASSAKKLLNFSPKTATTGDGKYTKLENQTESTRYAERTGKNSKAGRKSRRLQLDESLQPVVQPLDILQDSLEVDQQSNKESNGSCSDVNQLQQPVPKFFPNNGVGLGITVGRRALTCYKKKESLAKQSTDSDEDVLSSPDAKYRISYKSGFPSSGLQLSTVRDRIEMTSSSPLAASTPKQKITFTEMLQQEDDLDFLMDIDDRAVDAYGKDWDGPETAEVSDSELFREEQILKISNGTEGDTNFSNSRKKVVKKRATNDLRSFTKENDILTNAGSIKAGTSSRNGKTRTNICGEGSNHTAISKNLKRKTIKPTINVTAMDMDIDDIDELQMDAPEIYVTKAASFS